MNSEKHDIQHEKDRRVLDLIEQQGADLSRPYMIDHHFIATSKKDAEALGQWGRNHGFCVSDVYEDDYRGRIDYHVELSKPCFPTIEHIAPDTSLMVQLAERFKCTYDGWGCGIEA